MNRTTNYLLSAHRRSRRIFSDLFCLLLDSIENVFLLLNFYAIVLFSSTSSSSSSSDTNAHESMMNWGCDKMFLRSSFCPGLWRNSQRKFKTKCRFHVSRLFVFHVGQIRWSWTSGSQRFKCNHSKNLSRTIFVFVLAPKSPLQTRLLFHIAAKQDDEEKLTNIKRQLGNSVEDQLSLASMLYMKTQYHEAIEIYKRLLTENR